MAKIVTLFKITKYLLIYFTIMEEKLSFKEIYLLKKQSPSPAQAFINEISAITLRKPSTIRMWLNGTQSPDPLVKRQIAEHLKMSVEVLFPK